MKNKYSIGWGFGGCNMNCKHCYAGSVYACPQHMMDNLKKIADKICPLADSINFGTGEFIFNMNTVLLARYIKDKFPDIKLCVTTNGATFNLMGAKEAKEIFHDIDFSIDFPEPAKHNAFRGHPYAWDWAVNSLEICRREGIPTSIVTCVTGLTTDQDILGLLSLAWKFRCSWRVNWYRPTGRGRSDKKLDLSARRAWDVIRLLSQNAYFQAISDPLFDSILCAGHSDIKGCACGVQSCRIQTNLSVTPCVFLSGNQWSGGKISEKNLPEIFSSRTFNNLNKRQPKFCFDCLYFDMCRGGCASRSYLYCGNLNEPDAFCPFANGITTEELKNIKYKFVPKMGTEKLVHDGYLCTMIFEPASP
jgi:AdoMet-dependent heme synthase